MSEQKQPLHSFFDTTIPENSLISSQFVRCEVCGVLLRYITATHLRKHNMTVNDYLTKYPNVLLCSEVFKNNISKGMRRIPSFFNDQKVFVCPFCYKEVKSRRGLEVHIGMKHKIPIIPWWGFGVEGVDYIICRVCGSKFRTITSIHLEKHDITIKEYKKLFPQAPLSSETFGENTSRGLRKGFASGEIKPWNKGKTSFDKERVCVFCGKAFETNSKTHRFCTIRCSNINNWRVLETRERLMRNLETLFFRYGKDNPMYGRNQSGENNAFYGEHHTEETKKKKSLNNLGEKNSNWRGGIAYEPYDFAFGPDLKKQIKETDSHTCHLCGCDEKTKLAIHHIDYNKRNSNKNNLITLCYRCNSRANGSRNYWTRYFRAIICSRRQEGEKI